METPYTCIQRMYYNAMWAADAAQSQGIISECLRYWKIANRLEIALWNYKSVNLEKK
jgi:hypothetical protein